MANDLQFRIATPDDAPQVQQLIQAAFQAEDTRQNWTADMELGRNFRIGVDEVLDKITNPATDYLIATDANDNLIATVGIWKRDAELARLFNLAVDLKSQQGGLGRRVLSYAENYCQQNWGVKKTGMNALSTRELLLSWYIRCGYRKTGELTPFPVDKINGRKLAEDLCFIELEKDLDAVSVADECMKKPHTASGV